MTAGSRGDVAPYTGLGHALVRAGHEVTLVTHAAFAPLVAGSGVGFHPLPVDPRAELDSSRGRGLHRSASGAGKLLRVVGMARALVGRMTDDLLTAARSSDVLLLSSSLGPLGHAIAEGLSLPSMGVYLQPIAPTREFAPPVLGGGSWGTVGNRLAGRGVNRAVEHVFAAAVPELRTRLGLPRTRPGAALRTRERHDWPVHHGFSPLIVPRPADWRPGLTVAGYWWPYDGEAQLPSELGTSSTPVHPGLRGARQCHRARSGAAERRDRAGAAAGRAARGDPARLGRPRSGRRRRPDRRRGPARGAVPRMAAVVHHCGAGTTAAGLRAGVPAVPVPIQFDEGFWAARLVSLGVAPRAVPLRGLTAESLSAALVRAVREPAYAERAGALGARVRAEDGVAPVLAALDEYA